MKFTMKTQEKTKQYLIPNYGRFQVAPERGQGVRLWDEDGKRYLDFACGIAVCSLGHCHPAIVAALSAQGEKLWHCSNLYQIGPQAELAELLTERVVGLAGKCFFCNSGAEANETLIKLARKYGHATADDHGGRARFEVITFEGSFHGRTMCGISATGQEKVKAGFAPLLEGFKHVPWNDAEALRAAVSDDTVAILLEPVQGEGGINVVSEELLRVAVELREEKGILLMFDEIQSGLGRTGDLCSWRTVAPDLEPDAMSWAKGLGGGFPIGGIWAGERETRDGKLCDLLQPGSHGTTFGGTPLAASVGLAVVNTIVDNDLAANAESVGRYIVEEVEKWEYAALKGIRGLGLMLGFLIDDRVAQAGDVVKRLMDMGLLTVPAAGNVVRWLPPLNVTRSEADEALEIMANCLGELSKQNEG